MRRNYEPDPTRPLTTAYPYFPPEEQSWLHEQLAEILNGMLSMGPRVGRFEREFAAYCGAAHGVAFPSCTAALEAALRALGVGPGDEVLVPAETFAATAMAVTLVGAIPVFTEITPATFCMDLDDAWQRVRERARGAIVVHFGGAIAPGLPAFVERMHAADRFVIEDAAHTPGAELEGKRAGSLGDAACFSFYPTKIMTTGEGGMLTTSRDDVAAVARSLQHRGRDMQAREERYALTGRNNRFTEIAAAMGLSQLRCLDGFLEARRTLAARYDRLLGTSGIFAPLLPPPESRPSYWRYLVTCLAPMNRLALREALAGDGITIDWPYDPPAHLQPVYRKLQGTRPGMLPVTEEVMARHICLPMHARLREAEADYIIERLLHHGARLQQGHREAV